MNDTRRAVLEKHRAEMQRSGFASGEAFDKTVYAIAGATIAFTATYMKDLNKVVNPGFFLYSCWVLATIAIVSVAAGQYFNQTAHRIAIRAVDAELDGDTALQQQEEKKQDGLQVVVEKWFSPISLGSAVLGIVSFVVFIATQ